MDMLDQLQESGDISNSYRSAQIKPSSAETNLPHHSSGIMQKVPTLFTVDNLNKIAPSDQVVDSSTVLFPASLTKEHQSFPSRNENSKTNEAQILQSLNPFIEDSRKEEKISKA